MYTRTLQCQQIAADPPPCATLAANLSKLFSSAFAVTPAVADSMLFSPASQAEF